MFKFNPFTGKLDYFETGSAVAETDPVWESEKSGYVTKQDHTATPVDSIDSDLRLLYGVTGLPMYDWTNGLFTDVDSRTQLDLANRQLMTNEDTGPIVLNWENGTVKIASGASRNAYTVIDNANTQDRTVTLPDKDGTMAMLDDITFQSPTHAGDSVRVLASSDGINFSWDLAADDMPSTRMIPTPMGNIGQIVSSDGENPIWSDPSGLSQAQVLTRMI